MKIGESISTRGEIEIFGNGDNLGSSFIGGIRQTIIGVLEETLSELSFNSNVDISIEDFSDEDREQLEYLLHNHSVECEDNKQLVYRICKMFGSEGVEKLDQLLEKGGFNLDIIKLFGLEFFKGKDFEEINKIGTILADMEISGDKYISFLKKMFGAMSKNNFQKLYDNTDHISMKHLYFAGIEFILKLLEDGDKIVALKGFIEGLQIGGEDRELLSFMLELDIEKIEEISHFLTVEKVKIIGVERLKGVLNSDMPNVANMEKETLIALSGGVSSL